VTATRRRLLAAALVPAVAVLVPLLALPSTATPPGPRSAPPSPQTSTPRSTAPLAGAASDPATGGYWLAATNGGVFAFGAPFLGSAGALPLKSPVVGMTATTGGSGYLLVAADGGVFTYGDASFHGSTGALHLVAPVVGIAFDPVTGGYWLAASDGGVFAFDAPFLGSMGDDRLRKPVVGIAASADGGGYALVAADGGVFTFGDARFRGSLAGDALAAPIAAITPDPATGGYWLAGADGAVFALGAPFEGSAAPAGLARAAVALIAASHDVGYRIVSAAGGVYPFGGASLLGSVSVPPLAGMTVAIDPGHDGGNGSDPAYIDQPIDGGGIIESCDTAGTSTDAGYPEHAFNFDVALRLESLLTAEGARVVLTRTTDTGVGPCVNQRAAIENDSGAAAAISIHADGGPPGGRGFDVIEPVSVASSISNNTAIVGPSAALATDMRNAFTAATAEPVSDYSGTDGIDERGDLGGLNLSTVPKVLVECANMRNATDAALISSATWRQQAAQGLADGFSAYLTAIERP
jgi:N-acetylmuramoyl-L-alanine amidase